MSAPFRQHKDVLSKSPAPAHDGTKSDPLRDWKLTLTQPFVIVTNSYRASGGGHFPGHDGSNIVLAAPDGTRAVLAKWIEGKKYITASDLEPAS